MTTNEVVGVLQTCLIPHCKTCLSNPENGGKNCKGTEYALDALKIAIAAVKAQQEKPLTNADHIRAMDDEALANFLCVEGWMIGEGKECLEWLKQPYKEW